MKNQFNKIDLQAIIYLLILFRVPCVIFLLHFKDWHSLFYSRNLQVHSCNVGLFPVINNLFIDIFPFLNVRETFIKCESLILRKR